MISAKTGVCSFLFSALKRKDTSGHFQKLGLEFLPEQVAELDVSQRNVDPELDSSNHRIEITELAYQGESPLAIASALGIALDEVSLTLKLQEMSRRRIKIKNVRNLQA